MINKLFNTYPNKFVIISFLPGHSGALLYRILAHNPKYYWEESFSATQSSQTRKDSLDWPAHDIGYMTNPQCEIGKDIDQQRLTTVHVHSVQDVHIVVMPGTNEEVTKARKVFNWVKKAKNKTVLLRTHDMTVHEKFPQIKVVRICGSFSNRGDQYANAKITEPVDNNNVINVQLENLLSQDYKQFETEYFDLCKELTINPTPIPVRGYILNYLDRLRNHKNQVIPRIK